MPDFSSIRLKYIICKSCNIAKLLHRPSSKAVINPSNTLGRIKGDIFVIYPIPLNNKFYRFILINQKTRFKIIRFLKFKNKVIIKAKAAIKEIKNTFKRYPVHLYYNKGKEISRFRPYLYKKGIVFSESNPYAYNQNGLVKRIILVVLKRLRVVIIALGLLSSL